MGARQYVGALAATYAVSAAGLRVTALASYPRPPRHTN